MRLRKLKDIRILVFSSMFVEGKSIGFGHSHESPSSTMLISLLTPFH